jgi:predicted Zn-dependent peptidase
MVFYGLFPVKIFYISNWLQGTYLYKKLSDEFEKRNIPVIAVSTSVKFGAQHETEKIKGISHFIEHLVFKGTKNRSVTDIPREIEGKGGIINAFTGEEVTCFWNKLPSKYFSLGADISRDLVLNPLFEKEEIGRAHV